MAIHHALKRAREQSGLTLEEAAAKIGISGASFSRMENGLNNFTTDRLVKLATLYKVSASALVEGSVVNRPSTIDISRLKQVVEAVQEVVNRLNARPSPEKMASAVSELYKLEIERTLYDPDSTFDPGQHIGIVEAMFSD